MKTLVKFNLHKAVFAAALFAFSISPASAQSFDDVIWTLDTENEPEQDKDGMGITPSTVGATNNQGTFRFEISTTSTAALQRQEFQFMRRSGYHRFTGEFRIDSSQPNFDIVSVAQTHDDQIDSQGVFTIYQVRRENGVYVFGVQGDTTEAMNGYSSFNDVTNPRPEIELDTWYRLDTRTLSSTRDDSFEIAELYNSDNQLIWTETIVGGGEDEQYKKAGAYRLTNGFGRIIVDWREMTFFTGRR